MKVLTSEQTREVDRRTIEDGVAGIALMENAAHRVVEELVREYSPLESQNIVVLCGKGNNGGDGLALARILREYNIPKLRVVLAADPGEYSGDAKTNLDRLKEAKLVPQRNIQEKLRERLEVTLVIDALLGTGVKGSPTGRVGELIRATREFPLAKIVAVDLPSGLGGDGDIVKADITVTFTTPKVEHYLAPGAEDHVGRLVVTSIGCPPWLIPGGLEVTEKDEFAPLVARRRREAHKGDYGHVLVVGGSPGKSGAATMTGLAALRTGAGLVTVTAREATAYAPELMSDSLENPTLDRKTVLAIGPGLSLQRELVANLMMQATVPTVIDADGLNSIAGSDFRGNGLATILTPHPGEMARLLGRPILDPIKDAREFARTRNVCLVLKGHRTLIADPDGNVWINTSGTPGMATGGSGDILTGMIAGLVAQHPTQLLLATRAAVWLHGRCGELGVEELTEQCLIATDLLNYLPKAIRELQ